MITIKDKNLYKKIISGSKSPLFEKEEPRILIALSGGPDSVFLLHLFAQIAAEYTLTLMAAHLDHEWRSDSAKDVEFCQNLCQSLGVPLVTRKISELGIQLKINGSQEELGRKYRRIFLEQVAQEHGMDFIALAHHADDQCETFFIRLLRGSSLTGLTGMKSQDGKYIRPLLAVTKQEILTYLHEHNHAYLIDSTNESSAYLRNRIRQQVIPALQACDNRFDTTFFTTLQRLQEIEQFLDIQARKEAELVLSNGELNLQAFHALHSVMQYRILLIWFSQHTIPFPVSQSFFDEVIRFFKQETKHTHRIHYEWSLVKKNDHIIIRKNKTMDRIHPI